MAAEGISLLKRLSWIANVIFHQAVAVITIYVLSVIFSNLEVNSIETWHMILTTIGIMFLMAEGLILFMKDNIYTMYIPRSSKYLIHGILLSLSTICVTIGISFKIATKEGDHFTSTHAILGLVTWILLWCALFLGIATSQAKFLKNFIKPSWIKLIHILIGITTFTFGLLCLGFGMKKQFFESILSNKNTVLAAIIAMAILYIWALADTLKSLYNLIRSILGR